MSAPDAVRPTQHDLTAEEPNGNTASQQSAGSLITSYSGSIVLDRTGNTIIFDGGSSLIAAIGGNYRPDDDGFDDTDPANYGRTAPGPFGTTTYEAIRDLQFDLFDDTSGLGATVAPNGDFLSNSFGLEIESGESCSTCSVNEDEGRGVGPSSSQAAANSTSMGRSLRIVAPRQLTCPAL